MFGYVREPILLTATDKEITDLNEKIGELKELKTQLQKIYQDEKAKLDQTPFKELKDANTYYKLFVKLELLILKFNIVNFNSENTTNECDVGIKIDKINSEPVYDFTETFTGGIINGHRYIIIIDEDTGDIFPLLPNGHINRPRIFYANEFNSSSSIPYIDNTTNNIIITTRPEISERFSSVSKDPCYDSLTYGGDLSYGETSLEEYLRVVKNKYGDVKQDDKNTKPVILKVKFNYNSLTRKTTVVNKKNNYTLIIPMLEQELSKLTELTVDEIRIVDTSKLKITKNRKTFDRKMNELDLP